MSEARWGFYGRGRVWSGEGRPGPSGERERGGTEEAGMDGEHSSQRARLKGLAVAILFLCMQCPINCSYSVCFVAPHPQHSHNPFPTQHDRAFSLARSGVCPDLAPSAHWLPHQAPDPPRRLFPESLSPRRLNRTSSPRRLHLALLNAPSPIGGDTPAPPAPQLKV